MKRAITLAAALLLVACGGPEATARANARALLDFAAAMPYDLGPARTEGGWLEVIVADSSLNEYNGVFELLATVDSAREPTYRALPGTLLTSLPVTEILGELPLSRGGDSIITMFTFRRPADPEFNERVYALLKDADTPALREARRGDLRTMLKRARAELTTTDTVTIVTDSTGRIRNLFTASQTAQFAAYQARRARVHSALSRIVSEARIERFDFLNLARNSGIGGAMLSGDVILGATPWPTDTADIYVSLKVDCEATDRNNSLRTETWTGPPPSGRRGSMTVTCSWFGDSTVGWGRRPPTSFRARLVGPDSTTGPWFSYP